jgi:DcaP outer membrane protein
MEQARRYGRWMVGVAGVALICAANPASAKGASAREAQLEARVRMLESAMQEMRSALQASRGQQSAAQEQAAAALAQAQATSTRVAVIEAQPKVAAQPQQAAEGFRSGNTTIKIGGFLKTVATFSRWSDGEVAATALGRDFYLPQQIPVAKGPKSTDSDVNAKHTRLWLNLASDVAGHTVKGYVETDFQTTSGAGSERTTNGYNLALRRAYVQVDKFTIGQDWSTFQYVAALPESTDFVGVTEGTVFVRQPLVRYSAALSKTTTLHIAAENGETASATSASSTLIENDDDRIPDFAMRLNHTGKFGEVSLAGLVRQLSEQDRNGAGAITNSDKALGWGASAAGKIWLNGDKTADLRFMATYGQGIARYVGLNFAPDVIVTPITGQLRRIETLAAFGAVRLPLSKSVRTNLMASWQKADYPDGFAAGTFNGYNGNAWSVAGNLFWSPVKNIDVGAEYRHGQRELVSGVKGQLDRIEFAAKYSF